MLGEITLDLGTIASMTKYIIATLLIMISIMTFVVPLVLDYFSKPTRRKSDKDEFLRKDTGRSSDTPPPVGFAEHLRIIEETAPNADTSVWWDYAKAEMTEAEVAISEAKLARKPNG